MEPYPGEIRMVAFGYAPAGWLLCDGSQVSINAYPQLYATIRNNFGTADEGKFCLPRLTPPDPSQPGRLPMGSGSGPGLSPYNLGDQGGEVQVTLREADLPAHNHVLQANNVAGTASLPTDKVLARRAPSGSIYNPTVSQSPVIAMHPNVLLPAGGGQPHENMQPSLAINFVICSHSFREQPPG